MGDDMLPAIVTCGCIVVPSQTTGHRALLVIYPVMICAKKDDAIHTAIIAGFPSFGFLLSHFVGLFAIAFASDNYH